MSDAKTTNDLQYILTRAQLIELLTTAATIGRNETVIREAQTRSDITTGIETLMQLQLADDALTLAKVQLLHGRDPDSSCEIDVFLNGQALDYSRVTEESVDPGAGYDMESVEERISEAKEAAEKPDATDFDRAVAETLDSYRDDFVKYSTDD